MGSIFSRVSGRAQGAAEGQVWIVSAHYQLLLFKFASYFDTSSSITQRIAKPAILRVVCVTYLSILIDKNIASVSS